MSSWLFSNSRTYGSPRFGYQYNLSVKAEDPISEPSLSFDKGEYLTFSIDHSTAGPIRYVKGLNEKKVAALIPLLNKHIDTLRAITDKLPPFAPENGPSYVLNKISIGLNKAKTLSEGVIKSYFNISFSFVRVGIKGSRPKKLNDGSQFYLHQNKEIEFNFHVAANELSISLIKIESVLASLPAVVSESLTAEKLSTVKAVRKHIAKEGSSKSWRLETKAETTARQAVLREQFNQLFALPLEPSAVSTRPFADASEEEKPPASSYATPLPASTALLVLPAATGEPGAVTPVPVAPHSSGEAPPA